MAHPPPYNPQAPYGQPPSYQPAPYDQPPYQPAPYGQSPYNPQAPGQQPPYNPQAPGQQPPYQYQPGGATAAGPPPSSYPPVAQPSASYSQSGGPPVYQLNEFTFFTGFFPKQEADYWMARCLAEIPWAKKWWNLIYLLPQLAYQYDFKERKNKPCGVIEDIIARIETTFNTTIQQVWCNLFNDGSHHIEWHQDQYGKHCFIVSFGVTRNLDYRLLKDKSKIMTQPVGHGDIYYFAPNWDKIHEHRIVKDPSVKEKRVSFVMLSDPPYIGRQPPQHLRQYS